jgi:hypothetical protein
MFLRKTQRRKDGKTHEYWSVVENKRVAGGRVVQRHEIIGDPTLGGAILDRVIHRSHRIELKGESLRKRQALAAVESLTNAREK